MLAPLIFADQEKTMSEKSDPSERVLDFRIFKKIDLPPMTVRKGGVLIAPGSTEAVMYVVESGKLAVKVAGKIVEEVGPGQIVGEMSLIDHAARSAEVSALETTQVIPIDEARFLSLVVKVPHFPLLLMRQMARRIRKMNAQV
jgi:NTE family protein